MLPYIFVIIIAALSVKHFWRNWVITSALVVLYTMSVGAYIDCQIHNIPFESYVAKIGSLELWPILGETAFKSFIQVLAIFGAAALWRKIEAKITA
jgi:hypothetical protein